MGESTSDLLAELLELRGDDDEGHRNERPLPRGTSLTVQDTFIVPGLPVLASLGASALRQGHSVVVLAFERPAEHYERLFRRIRGSEDRLAVVVHEQRESLRHALELCTRAAEPCLLLADGVSSEETLHSLLAAPKWLSFGAAVALVHGDLDEAEGTGLLSVGKAISDAEVTVKPLRTSSATGRLDCQRLAGTLGHGRSAGTPFVVDGAKLALRRP